MLVPFAGAPRCLKVWDTLAIGEYLHEIKPKAGLLPAEIKARAPTAAPSVAKCTRASASLRSAPCR